MTKDQFEKDMLTDVNRRLINFTLRKSFGLYSFLSAAGKKNNPTIS